MSDIREKKLTIEEMCRKWPDLAEMDFTDLHDFFDQAWKAGMLTGSFPLMLDVLKTQTLIEIAATIDERLPFIN